MGRLRTLKNGYMHCPHFPSIFPYLEGCKVQEYATPRSNFSIGEGTLHGHVLDLRTARLPEDRAEEAEASRGQTNACHCSQCQSLQDYHRSQSVIQRLHYSQELHYGRGGRFLPTVEARLPTLSTVAMTALAIMKMTVSSTATLTATSQRGMLRPASMAALATDSG